ncbi:hypothetical protein [Bacteroides caccae]|uniref:hypothetical protein n=1 Tax=Bacteroides caccae TaxID=47678 RepID=UPI0022AA1DE2|nr:hypothetical protein [Bacteroides caccae]MCZ2726298.1 hypothetical protein [Bacteroides caccae]
MEKDNVQKKVANTISERPIIIWFGCLPFIVRPLTFTQLFEIGAISKDMPEVDQNKVDGRTNVSATLLYYEEARRMSDIAVMTIFRSVWRRKLFGKFIKKRLTVRKYKKLQDYMAQTMDATFFLSTIIFLKGLNETTKPTNTPEATALGAQSAE